MSQALKLVIRDIFYKWKIQNKTMFDKAHKKAESIFTDTELFCPNEFMIHNSTNKACIHLPSVFLLE